MYVMGSENPANINDEEKSSCDIPEIKDENVIHPDNFLVACNCEEKKTHTGKTGTEKCSQGGKVISQRLKPSEKRFVAEYCKDLNATNAYLRSKPHGTVTRESARRCASEMKNRPHVLSAIEDRISTGGEWVNNARRRVIETLLNCLDAEHLDFLDVVIDEEGDVDLKIKDLRKVPKQKRMALCEINVKKSTIPGKHGTIEHKNTKIKPIAKQFILKMLIDVLGMKEDIDADEKDRSSMERATKSVSRRITGILKGLRKRKSLEKLEDDNKGIDG